jgi:hypothetical protein
MSMKSLVLSLLLAAAVVPGLSPVAATAPRDSDEVYDQRRSGRLRPLPEIERMVLPRMNGARYIGPEIIDNVVYRLKFMRGSSVIWVDVDGRTGAIVGRTGE